MSAKDCPLAAAEPAGGVPQGLGQEGEDGGAAASSRRDVAGYAARPLCAIGTGTVAALCQLGLLTLLTHRQWAPIPANALALELGTVVNFTLSYAITWRDRRPEGSTPRLVIACLCAYQAAMAATALLNLLLFEAARHLLPLLLAALLATSLTAVLNFVLNDHLVFPLRAARRPLVEYIGGTGGHRRQGAQEATLRRSDGAAGRRCR